MENKLTSSLEDYLETIYNLIEKNEKVRAVDISKVLGVSRASVSEALKKLDEKGFVNYGRYDTLAITELGKKTAQDVIMRHNTLRTFLEKVLGASQSEAQENACRFEHVISQDILDRLCKFTEFYTQKNENEFLEFYSKE